MRDYLSQQDSTNSKCEISLSALGEMSYHGPATGSRNARPQVLWTDLGRLAGFQGATACFKPHHAFNSHSLSELPYSSGIIRLPPHKPRTLHDADDLIHALGLRESNLEILLKVTSLDLSGHRVAALPDRLVMLKNLCCLDASRNGLAALPSHLETLTRLTHLNLNDNAALFSDGILPASVLRLSQLRRLELANTGLEHVSKMISQLRDLALLDVSRNRVSALPRKELAEMLTLVTMACEGNPQVAQRVCGIPEEVARTRSTTTRVRDGDKHANIPISDTWNWTPDGVLGYLRHRPHMLLPVRNQDGRGHSGGWARSSSSVVLEAYGAGDRAAYLIDELLRLVIFLRRAPFPSSPRGPQLAYAYAHAEVAGAPGTKDKGRRGRKGGKGNVGAQAKDKYYVSGRIHDIWLQFQADYSHLTKSKPGHETVFFKHLLAALNKTTLLSALLADLARLFKIFNKKFAREGFPFPPSYLKDRVPGAAFPGKGVHAQQQDGRQAVGRGSRAGEADASASEVQGDGRAAAKEDSVGQSKEEAESDGDDGEEQAGVDAGGASDSAAACDDDDDDDDDEAEAEADVNAAVKKFDVWEFHGVMFLICTEIRANGHLKGSVADGKKKGKGKKGKKKK